MARKKTSASDADQIQEQEDEKITPVEAVAEEKTSESVGSAQVDQVVVPRAKRRKIIDVGG